MPTRDATTRDFLLGMLAGFLLLLWLVHLGGCMHRAAVDTRTDAAGPVAPAKAATDSGPVYVITQTGATGNGHVLIRVRYFDTRTSAPSPDTK